MKKEKLEVERYEKEYNREKYYIYIIPEDDDKMTNFYIQKAGYSFISMEIGLLTEQLETSIEEYIENNLGEWAYSYDLDIEKLES